MEAHGADDADVTGDAPLTVLEQLELETRWGERDWYATRRAASPAGDRPEAAAAVALPLERLRQASRVPLADFVPEEAPVLAGGPRALGRPRPAYRRRFDGRRVIPMNSTQIWDGESRQVYRDTSFPWVCVGRLGMVDGDWGTAALVGRSVILTASHVLAGRWRPDQPLRETITFVPASFDNVSLLGRDWSANVVNIAAWETATAADGYDMAVCQLDQPMGEWLGHFGARTYDDDWEDRSVWAHAGYPWDFGKGGHRPTFELGIDVHDDDSDDYDTLELETRADAGSGQSGGPLWGVFGDGGRQVVGTMSGIEDNTAEETNTLFAGGTGLVELIRWGRDHWS